MKETCGAKTYLRNRSNRDIFFHLKLIILSPLPLGYRNRIDHAVHYEHTALRNPNIFRASICKP